MNIILKKEAIEYINKIFSLPYTGIEQDWDLEMANSDRVIDFIYFYKNENLSRDKKIALMSLIISSYDDYLNKNYSAVDDLWNEIKNILESEKEIFFDLINYWSLHAESVSENHFKITPLMRTIKVV